MAASEPSPPRTVIRLRVLGVVVAALFSLMFIRLWYLQVLDTSAYSKTVTANQVRARRGPRAARAHHRSERRHHRGRPGDRDITLSRVAAQQHPAVVGQLAAAPRHPAPPRSRPTSPTSSTACTSPFPSSRTPRCRTSSTSASTPRCSPACRRWPTPTAPIPSSQTGVQMLGYVGQITSQQLQSQPVARATSSVTSSGRAGSRTSTRSALRGRPGIDRVEVNAQRTGGGQPGRDPAHLGRRRRDQRRLRARADVAAGTRRRDRVAQGKVQGRRGRRPRPPDRRGARRSCPRPRTTRRGGPTGSPRPTTARSSRRAP